MNFPHMPSSLIIKKLKKKNRVGRITIKVIENITIEVFLIILNCLLAWMHSHILLTLRDPMNCSPPASSVHGISQARILEWIAVFSSRRSSWHRDWTHISCVSYIAGVFFFYFFYFFFLFVVDFVIHWNETAMGLHVFPIPIPPPTSLSTRSL